jgi:hypothetical protein
MLQVKKSMDRCSSKRPVIINPGKSWEDAKIKQEAGAL